MWVNHKSQGMVNRAQYGIDLPGSLHTNKIPVILGRYPLLDVVEKVNFLVAASKHGGTSVAEGSPLHVDRNGFVLVTFHGGGIIFCDFLKNEILGFDENLAEVL